MLIMKNTIKLVFPVLGFLMLMSCDTKTYEDISDLEPITKTVTYNKNVKAIIDNNCVVCHSVTGSNPSFPLTNYNAVKNSVDNILDRIQRANGDPLKMPQGGTLSQDNINMIIKWKADGLLEN
jgi:mono/diheme cytochrome c family protein